MNVRRIREEDKQWLLENYKNKTIGDCASALGVSERTMIRWAKELGLPKKRECNIKGIRRSTELFFRKDCTIKKCCLVCNSYKSCQNTKDKEIDPHRMVCFEFNLHEDLKIDKDD